MTQDFGRDALCFDSLKTGRYATGLRLVAQRCYHRLTTPRGMLLGGEEDANFGIDLCEEVGRADTASSQAALPGRIKSELLKDAQIADVDVRVKRWVDGPAVSYAVEITAYTSNGPFDMVLSVSDVKAAMVGLSVGDGT